MRALWASGTKAYDGERVRLPETTCYPRPVSRIPVIVGGGGEHRTLRIAASLGDATNVPSSLETLDRKVEVLRAHCRDVGRDPAEVAITVLDLPVVGRDRDDTWSRVERLRGRCRHGVRGHPGPGRAGRRDGAGRPDGLSYLSSALDRPRIRRATISCWICCVPSKMSRILESRAHFSSSSVSL
jgi:alkanesulfonate monooxygenase SsuD/methylene tetrahydromethanopterin reductase-like flavin-dependent oxidoreductase (luciferase family)